MQFMLIIAHDDAFRAGPELVPSIHAWIEQHANVRVHGAPLRPAAEAVTVQVRDGNVASRPGPFRPSGDHIAAFDILEAEDIEQAVAIASSHPMAAAATIEVRPLWGELSGR